MTFPLLLFRAGAFAALVLLVRHAWRTEGGRVAGILVGYLTVMAVVREWTVASVSHAIDQPVPYRRTPKLGHIGLVNLVVVAGWVFTALVSFELARMIQRRNFPGTNVFLTLALTALVTTTISYAVEITGMRIHLWRGTRAPGGVAPVRLAVRRVRGVGRDVVHADARVLRGALPALLEGPVVERRGHRSRWSLVFGLSDLAATVARAGVSAQEGDRRLPARPFGFGRPRLHGPRDEAARDERRAARAQIR